MNVFLIITGALNNKTPLSTNAIIAEKEVLKGGKMKECDDCTKSYYESTFRRRFCLAKKIVIHDNHEAEKCDRYVNRYKEWEEFNYGTA